MNTIILFPGGFKPPHAGHIAIAKEYAKNPNVKEVQMLIGPKSRDGITREQSLLALKMLIKDPKIKIVAIDSENPMQSAFDIILNLPKELLKEFLEGYLSGDGCETKDTIMASTISKKLA